MRWLIALFDVPNAKEEFLAALRLADPSAEVDPEGNPVRVWVKTSLDASQIVKLPHLYDGIPSEDQS